MPRPPRCPAWGCGSRCPAHREPSGERERSRRVLPAGLGWLSEALWKPQRCGRKGEEQRSTIKASSTGQSPSLPARCPGKLGPAWPQQLPVLCGAVRKQRTKAPGISQKANIHFPCSSLPGTGGAGKLPQTLKHPAVFTRIFSESFCFPMWVFTSGDRTSPGPRRCWSASSLRSESTRDFQGIKAKRLLSQGRLAQFRAIVNRERFH